MNVLTSTWRQLVRRRLWPVAVLLVAAIAAVPVLLSREATPVDPQPTAPVQPAKTDDSLATPVVAKATVEDRSRRRRVLGSRKDPFKPAPVKKPKVAKKATVKKQAKSGTKSTGGGTPAPSSTPAPSATPAPTATPAPKPSSPKGSLVVRFGDARADALPLMLLEKLDPLPDDKTPLLVYMGLTDKGKKAVFLVDASLDASGDGQCQPHPANCEKIVLAKGETEFFDVVDAETGDVSAQYELDLLAIN